MQDMEAGDHLALDENLKQKINMLLPGICKSTVAKKIKLSNRIKYEKDKENVKERIESRKVVMPQRKWF